MALSPTRARMLGQLGMANRWAKTVSAEDRRAATQKARDAQQAKLYARAVAMPGSEGLTEAELLERARQLRLADLAAMRLKRWTNRQRPA